MTEQTAAPFPQKDRFPLFCDVRGKKALVVGGGAVSARRCRTLCRFSDRKSTRLNSSHMA